MLSQLINEDLIDSKVQIEFSHKTVTIHRVTNVHKKYTHEGTEIIIEGDISPNENGDIKRRVFRSVENSFDSHLVNNSYKYTCDYEKILLVQETILSFSVIKKSNDLSFFNRLQVVD